MTSNSDMSMTLKSTVSRIPEISSSLPQHIIPILALIPRGELTYKGSFEASTSKPNPITQDVTMMNMMHQTTNAGIKRTLHVRLICTFTLSTMRPLPSKTISSHMPRLMAMQTRHLPRLARIPGLQVLSLTPACTLVLVYVARLQSTRCLCDTLGLILVPLTHTMRAKLYLLLSLS